MFIKKCNSGNLIRSITRVGFFSLTTLLGLQGCFSGSDDSTPGDSPNTAPTVSDVTIVDDNGGNLEYGDMVSTSYIYNDVDEDQEGASVYRWLRNDVVISGAIESSYIITVDDSAANISFEVTPIAETGTLTGDSVRSAPLSVITFDTTPDAFSFVDQTDVPVSTELISNSITVSGINVPANITIINGQYSIDGGTYTNAPGTVVNGQSVTVKQTSSNSSLTTTNTVLTIGGIEDTFSVTTPLLNVLPTADAGTDQVVLESTSVSLDGSLSADVDGSIVSYSWSQTSGTVVTLNDSSIANPVFTAPGYNNFEVLTFNLAVTDNSGDTSFDAVDVSVSEACNVSTMSAVSGAVPGSIAIDINSGATGCLAPWDKMEVRRNTGGLAPQNCTDGVVVHTYNTVPQEILTDLSGFPGMSFGYRLCEFYSSGLVRGDSVAVNIQAAADLNIDLHLTNEINGEWPNTNFLDDLPRDGQALGVAVLPDGTSYAVGYQTELVNSSTDKDIWIRKFSPTGVEIIAGWNKRIDNDKGKEWAADVEVDNLGNVYVLLQFELGYPSSIPAHSIIRSYTSDGTERLDGWPKVIDATSLETYGSNLLLVTSDGTGLISYNSDGTEAFSTPISGSPRTLFINPAGDIFVGGDITGQAFLKRFSKTGVEIVTNWDKLYAYTSSTSIYAIAEDSAGSIYVGGDSGSTYHSQYYIKKFSNLGVEDTTGWGVLDEASTWKHSIDALVVDSQDNIYAAGIYNQSLLIKKFSADGTEITLGWDKKTDYPSVRDARVGLGLMPDDSILVGIPSSTGDWIRHYDSSGTKSVAWQPNHPSYGGDDKIAALAVSGTQIFMGGVTSLREKFGTDGSYPVTRQSAFLSSVSVDETSTPLLWKEDPFYRDGVMALEAGSDNSLYALSYSYGNTLWKFNATTGAILWSKNQYSSAGYSNKGSSMAIDTCDNVYFGQQLARNFISATSGEDWSIKKITQDGTYVTEWEQTYDTEIPAVLLTGNNGGLFVLGSNQSEWWIKKFDASITNCATETVANVNWNIQLPLGGSVLAGAIDSTGNLYAVGSSSSGWRIKKFNLDGTEITTGWDKSFGSTTDSAQSIAIDNALGYVYVAGALSNQVALDSKKDIYVVRYSLNGTQVDGNGFPFVYDGGYRGDDEATALKVMPDGSVIIGGYAEQHIDANTGSDYFIMRVAAP